MPKQADAIGTNTRDLFLPAAISVDALRACLPFVPYTPFLWLIRYRSRPMRGTRGSSDVAFSHTVSQIFKAFSLKVLHVGHVTPPIRGYGLAVGITVKRSFCGVLPPPGKLADPKVRIKGVAPVCGRCSCDALADWRRLERQSKARKRAARQGPRRRVRSGYKGSLPLPAASAGRSSGWKVSPPEERSRIL
jgi:hypothetical protein